MTVNEASRHHLHEAARATLGDDAAVTLMEMLPPVGWADVATKRDLDHLEERMDLRFDKVDLRFEQIDARFEQIDARFEGLEERQDLRLNTRIAELQRTMTMWFVGILVVIAAATGFLRFV